MFRVSAKTTRWDEACNAARKIEQQLHEANPISIDSTPIEQAVSAYLNDKRAQQLSPDTLKKLELYFEKQLLGWCAVNGVRSLADLDLIRLREWRNTWKDGPQSSKKKQERVIGFFHFCQSSGWIRDNPARRLSRIKVTQKPTDYFTEEEIDRIIAATTRSAAETSCASSYC
jgi:site-specific recombinase XerD